MSKDVTLPVPCLVQKEVTGVKSVRNLTSVHQSRVEHPVQEYKTHTKYCSLNFWRYFCELPPVHVVYLSNLVVFPRIKLSLSLSLDFAGNPFPGRDVVTFKLSSRQMPEVVDGPQGNKVIRTVQLETVFEMNYTTGTWRKLQVKRVIE